jgi:hypothetical protein
LHAQGYSPESEDSVAKPLKTALGIYIHLVTQENLSRLVLLHETLRRYLACYGLMLPISWGLYSMPEARLPELKERAAHVLQIAHIIADEAASKALNDFADELEHEAATLDAAAGRPAPSNDN